MRSKPFLYAVALLLGLSAVAVPILLERMPLILRLLVGFTDLLAAFAVAMAIRQRGQPRPPSGKPSGS